MGSGGLAHLRYATAADAAVLAEVQVLAWRESYQGLVPEPMLAEMSIDGRTRAWARILAAPPGPVASIVYLVERGGEAIGFGSCGRQRNLDIKAQGFEGEISALYVRRAFQARGIGASLLRRLAAELLKLGLTAASLWVLKHNSPARRFYEHMGGELIGEKQDARDGGVLLEVAYGWRDVAALAGPYLTPGRA